MNGEKIRQLRRNKGYSQEVVAEHLGVSQSTLARMEMSSAKLDGDQLVALSKLFECSLDELLSNTKVEFSNNTFKNQCAGYVEKIVNCQKELYEEQINFLKKELTVLKEMIQIIAQGKQKNS